MSGWDQGSITYSDSINGGVERDDVRSNARAGFLNFFREFRDGPIFIYRQAPPPPSSCLYPCGTPLLLAPRFYPSSSSFL